MAEGLAAKAALDSTSISWHQKEIWRPSIECARTMSHGQNAQLSKFSSSRHIGPGLINIFTLVLKHLLKNTLLIRLCPGSFFTLHENPLCWFYGLLVLPVLAAAALAHYGFKKRSRKSEKIVEVETERLKTEAFLESGGVYQDLTDDNHNNN